MLLSLMPKKTLLSRFQMGCSVFKVNISSNAGGLALTSKTPHTPDSSPDICRFQPSPSYAVEVCQSHKTTTVITGWFQMHSFDVSLTFVGTDVQLLAL